MFSFSLSQGLVEHILMISHGIMVGNYVKRKKKWCLMKTWAKLPKVKRKKKEQRKRKKVFLYVLKILCWKSLKSKEDKHWWLKMENLCALMKYLVWNIIFLECSTFFGLDIFFYSLLPHLNLSPITTRK